MDVVNHYTYRVSWSDEDQEYLASCAEFPSLSQLEESPEKALSGIRSVVAECVADMRASKEAIPEPLSAKSYSGKFIVRVPPQLHRQLATLAAEAGVSLNRLVSSRLA